MEYIDLQATTREATGKGVARKLRREGRLPAVLYGGDQDPISLAIETKAIERVLKSHSGGHSIINLKIDDGGAQYALVKDVQSMTMRYTPIHVDLVRISMDKTVEVAIPVELINTEAVKRAGGIIQQIVSEVNIECLPDRIPDSIKVDLAGFAVGDAITVADLKVDEGITLLDDEEEVIASVLAPKADDKPTAEAAPVDDKKAGDKKAGDKKDDKAKAGDKKDDKGGKK